MMYKHIGNNSKEESIDKFIRAIMVCYLVIYGIAQLYNLVMLLVGKSYGLSIPEGVPAVIVLAYLVKKKRRNRTAKHP